MSCRVRWRRCERCRSGVGSEGGTEDGGVLLPIRGRTARGSGRKTRVGVRASASASTRRYRKTTVLQQRQLTLLLVGMDEHRGPLQREGEKRSFPTRPGCLWATFLETSQAMSSRNSLRSMVKCRRSFCRERRTTALCAW